MEHMKLVQSMFIFLFINTKHGYSSETNCSYLKKLELYRETVEKCQDRMVSLRNFYDKNYYQIIPIFLPEYRQFKIKSEYSDSKKVETLLEYNAILLTYHSAFVDFKRKETRTFGLPTTIENIINNLDKIIDCFKPDRQTVKSRFNKTEIKKKNRKHYEVKTIYAIIVQFLNFLSNVIRILSEFLRLAPN